MHEYNRDAGSALQRAQRGFTLITHPKPEVFTGWPKEGESSREVTGRTEALTVSLHVLSISWGTEESGTYQMWESHSSEPCLKSWWQGSILQCCTICVELSNSEKVRVENWENYTRTQKGNQEKRNKQKLETSCYLPLTVESCLSGHENSLKLIIMELIIRKFCHDEFWMLKKGSLGQAVVAHNFI